MVGCAGLMNASRRLLLIHWANGCGALVRVVGPLGAMSQTLDSSRSWEKGEIQEHVLHSKVAANRRMFSTCPSNVGQSWQCCTFDGVLLAPKLKTRNQDILDKKLSCAYWALKALE